MYMKPRKDSDGGGGDLAIYNGLFHVLPIETSGGGYWSFKFLNYTELGFLNIEIGEEFSGAN